MSSRDPLTDRFLALGKAYDAMMANASLERCNCMVRYGGGDQLPAIRRGKRFTTPEGEEIAKPDSFEDMKPRQIKELMKSHNEIYIGHMFKP